MGRSVSGACRRRLASNGAPRKTASRCAVPERRSVVEGRHLHGRGAGAKLSRPGGAWPARVRK